MLAEKRAVGVAWTGPPHLGILSADGARDADTPFRTALGVGTVLTPFHPQNPPGMERRLSDLPLTSIQGVGDPGAMSLALYHPSSESRVDPVLSNQGMD